MLFISTANLNAFGIPVIDWKALSQRIEITAKKLKKWIDYIEQFNYYRKKFDALKMRFEATIRRFNDGEIDDLFGGIDVDKLMAVLESTVYDDKNNLDEWRKIFKDINQLIIKYPDLKNYNYVIKNRFYKSTAKELIDIEIKRNNEQLQDYQKIMIDLNEMRKMETELITNKYKGYRDKIKEFSDGAMSPNLLKIYVLIDMIDMEILKLNYSMMVLLRTYFELDIKERTNEMDSIMTELMYKAKNKQVD